MSVKLSFLLLFTIFVLAESEIFCPPAVLYEPCECNPDTGNETILLYCSYMNLTDSRTSDILNAFLAPEASPVSRMEFADNLLTRIPSQLPLFDQLNWVFFNRNKFSNGTIRSGSFNFTAPVKYLNLYNTSISSIEPGAFQGNYGPVATGYYATIYLARNSLTRFESQVFQRVLEMNATIGIGYYENLDSANPIDCEMDPCHLAWLIRDNRQFLPQVRSGYCSNGTAFEELDPNTICPN